MTDHVAVDREAQNPQLPELSAGKSEM